MAREIIYQSVIEDEFNGFDDEVIFELANGTFWVQSRYKYQYRYSYRPEAWIVREKGQLLIHLPSLDMEVEVNQVNAVKSRIIGEFKGWDGETEFKLENGQVWKQNRYAYRYMYAYYPSVLIAEINGGYNMSVNGESVSVRRIK